MNMDARHYRNALNKMLKNPITATRSIAEAMKGQAAKDYINGCLDMFFAGNYGTITERDIDANREEMTHAEGRIVARYAAKDILNEDIYIISYFSLLHDAPDFNYTTVMYCNEY